MAGVRCDEVGATRGRWWQLGATRGRWWQVTGTRGRRQQVVMPHLLLLLLLLNSAAADKVVESLRDGFGYYYKIAGYALNDPADYQVVQVTSGCECHRRCQVLPTCHSVSVLTTAGGASECRVSQKPAVLTNVADRPKLYRNPTAIHFLFTAPPNWNEVEDDGFEYQTTGLTFSWGQGPSWCTGNVRLVNIITLDQMRIIMGETAKNTRYWVNLSRKPGGQPTWDAGGAAIPYNQTDLDPTSLVDKTSPSLSSYFYLTHNGSHYTFTGTSSVYFYFFICQDNLLNLVL
ncbi:uncharacterized protein [Procambarus clarkii]|uniref:uncharacterized protein n=1 Tax=Procambarus clarkii TaxID=6728 RepID=UPI003742F1D3